jgi:hypothetical protein
LWCTKVEGLPKTLDPRRIDTCDAMVITLCCINKNDMTKFWLTIGVVSFLLIGCGESGSDNEKEAETNGPETVQENKADNGLPIQDNAGGQVEQLPAAVPASGAGLNPPHGQPGHDCAIAVGAPSNGSGAQVQTPATQPAIQPTVQPATPPAAKTNIQSTAPSGKLNPAHGQPGHDCAVAVGAPLPGK